MFVFPVGSPFRLRVSHHLDHATFPVSATSNAACDWDRNRARPALGGRFPYPALSIAGRVHNSTMAYVSRSPPIIPDGQISRVRFETSAILLRAFPRLGEV